MQVALQSIDILLRAVVAEFVFLAFLFIGDALSRRFFNPSNASVRWSVAILIALYVATIAFHLLSAAQQFRLLPAVLLLGVVTLLVHRFIQPFAAFARGLTADLRSFVGLFLTYRRDWRIIPVIAFSCLVLVTMAKTLLIPPLGWDSMTYHCVKPAMWLQTGGGPLTMEAPGGWSYFSLFVAGGEVLWAWSMLPFHSDLLTPFLGAALWISTGFVLFAAGRYVGLSRWSSLMAAFFVLFVPAVHRLVGSGYTEPVLALDSLGAVLVGVCYLSDRNPACLVLSLALAGMMAGTESEALPLSGMLALVLSISVLGNARLRGAHLKWLFLGAALAVLAVVPWWINSYLRTGYPLSPVGLKLFGITLGTAVPELEWQMSHPVISTLGKELNVLGTLFSFDVKMPHLGPFMLLPVFLFPAGIAALWRRNRWEAVLLASVVSGVLAAFYFPGMTAIRVEWAPTNSRLVLSLVPLATLGAAAAFRDAPKRSRLFSLGLAILAAYQAFDGVFWGVDGIIMTVMPFLALALILLAGLGVRLLAAGRTVAVYSMLTLVPLFFLPVLAQFRDRTRAEVFADEGMMTWHYTLRYWSDAARVTDDPARPVKITVTSAPWEGHDSWLDYAFLGRRFQNTLVYVPITESGRFAHFDGTEAYQQGSSYEVWLRRLREWDVDYVMSFWPTSIELMWIRQHPEPFEKLSSGEKWGFYRVRNPATPGNTPPGATRDPR